LLMKNQQVADGVNTDRTSAGPMAPALQTGLPCVGHAVREAGTGATARLGDKKVTIDGSFVDTGFFQMFSFPALTGDPETALHDPNSIILTESAAKKLFGDKNAMGW